MAISTANRVGADTAVSAPAPALMVFCTISKLARLVMALEPPTAGRVLLDGQPLPDRLVRGIEAGREYRLDVEIA